MLQMISRTQLPNSKGSQVKEVDMTTPDSQVEGWKPPCAVTPEAEAVESLKVGVSKITFRITESIDANFMF
jgi:hypothetical protein